MANSFKSTWSTLRTDEEKNAFRQGYIPTYNKTRDMEKATAAGEESLAAFRLQKPEQPEQVEQATEKPAMQNPFNTHRSFLTGQEVQSIFGSNRAQSQITDTDRAAAAYQPSTLKGIDYFRSLSAEDRPAYSNAYKSAWEGGADTETAMEQARQYMEQQKQTAARTATRKMDMEAASEDVNSVMGVNAFNAMDEADQDKVLEAWKQSSGHGVDAIYTALREIGAEEKYGISTGWDRKGEPFRFQEKTVETETEEPEQRGTRQIIEDRIAALLSERENGVSAERAEEINRSVETLNNFLQTQALDPEAYQQTRLDVQDTSELDQQIADAQRKLDRALIDLEQGNGNKRVLQANRNAAQNRLDQLMAQREQIVAENEAKQQALFDEKGLNYNQLLPGEAGAADEPFGAGLVKGTIQNAAYTFMAGYGNRFLYSGAKAVATAAEAVENALGTGHAVSDYYKKSAEWWKQGTEYATAKAKQGTQSAVEGVMDIAQQLLFSDPAIAQGVGENASTVIKWIEENVVGSTFENLGGMFPSMIMDVMTGGATAAYDIAATGAEAAAALGGRGMASQLASGIQQAMSNPGFGATFALDYFGNIAERIDAGENVTPTDALWQLMGSYVSALIEYGGDDVASGFQALLQNDMSGMKGFIHSELGESVEEITQNITQRVSENMAALMQPGADKKVHPFYSDDISDEALINFAEIWDTAWRTWVTTAGMTGVHMVTSTVMQGIIVKAARGQDLTEEERTALEQINEITRQAAETSQQHDNFETAMEDPNADIRKIAEERVEIQALTPEQYRDAMNRRGAVEPTAAEALRRKEEAEQQAEATAVAEETAEAENRQQAEAAAVAEETAETVEEQQAVAQNDNTVDTEQGTEAASVNDVGAAQLTNAEARAALKDVSAADISAELTSRATGGDTDPRFDGMSEKQLKNAMLRKANVVNTAQTQTAEFRDWFRDSKTVKADGTPITYYHGTDQDFDAFSADKIGSRSADDKGFYGKGYYFANYEESARLYGKNVMKVWLKIENPFMFEQMHTVDGQKAPSGYETAAFALYVAENMPDQANAEYGRARTKDGQEISLTVGQFAEMVRNALNETGDLAAAVQAVRDQYEGISARTEEHIIQDMDFISELQRMGYDGIMKSEGFKETVVFSPEQIKSATGNSGKFDAANPDIYDSEQDEAAEQQPEETQEAGEEQAVESAEVTERNAEALTPEGQQTREEAGRVEEGQASEDQEISEEVKPEDERKAGGDSLRAIAMQELTPNGRRVEEEALGRIEEGQASEDQEISEEPKDVDEMPTGDSDTAEARKLMENPNPDFRPEYETPTDEERKAEAPEARQLENAEREEETVTAEEKERRLAQLAVEGEAVRDEARGTIQEGEASGNREIREEVKDEGSRPTGDVAGAEGREEHTNGARTSETESGIRTGQEAENGARTSEAESGIRTGQEPQNGAQINQGESGIRTGQETQNGAQTSQGENGTQIGQQTENGARIDSEGREDMTVGQEPQNGAESKDERSEMEIGQEQNTEAEQANRTAAERYGFKYGATAGDGGSDSGVHLVGAGANISESRMKELQLIDTFAKKMGFSVEVHAGLVHNANGMYRAGGRTVYLNQNTGEAFQTVVGHEITHMVYSISPNSAKAIEKVFDRYAAWAGIDVNQRVEALTVRYATVGEKLSAQAAKEELIANSMFSLLSDQESLRRVYAADKNIFSRIMDYVSRVQRSIQEMLRSYEARTPEARMLREQGDALHEMHRMMLDTLEEMMALDKVRRKGTAVHGNGEMTKRFEGQVREATSRREMTQAARELAREALKETGNEVNDNNVMLMMYAADAVRGGELPGQAMREMGLKYESNNPEVNRALQMLGGYTGALHEDFVRTKDAAELEGLYNGTEENAEFRTQNAEREAEGERYSLKDMMSLSWEDQLDRVLDKNGAKRDDVFDIADKRDMAKYPEIGKMVVAPQRVINKAMRINDGTTSRSAHSISRTTMAQLREAVKKPAAIITNGTDTVIVTDLDDGAGNKIILTLKDIRYEGQFDTKSATSIYGRENMTTLLGHYDNGVYRLKNGVTLKVYKDNAIDILKAGSKQYGAQQQVNDALKTIAQYGNDVKTHFSLPDIFESSDEKIQEDLPQTREELGKEIVRIKNEQNNLRDEIKRFENETLTEDLMERMTGKDEAVKDQALAEYKVAEDKAHVREKQARIKEIDKIISRMNRQFQALRVQALRQDIEKSGLTQQEYFSKAAVKEFGYTPYYYDAGYIMANGKMLNFSGEKGKHFGTRGEDHRRISTIFEGMFKEGTTALNAFVNMGNVRIMDESPGVDIAVSVKLTPEQRTTIRKHINQSIGQRGYYVDFTGSEGHTIASMEYGTNARADKILADIDYVQEHGEAPRKSDVADFHARYSLNDAEDRAREEYYEREFEADGSELGMKLLDRLREMKREQKTEQYGNWRQHIAEMARELYDVTGTSVYDAKGLEKELTRIFEEFEGKSAGTKEDADRATGEALNELKGLITETLMDQMYSEEYRDFKHALRKGIYLNREQVRELGGTAELRDFRRALAGTARVYTNEQAAKKAGAIYLEGGGWEELQSVNPHVFDPDMHWMERAQAIRDYVDSNSDPVTRLDPETRRFIANEALTMMAQYYEGSNEDDATKRTREALDRANKKVQGLERKLEQGVKQQLDLEEQVKAAKQEARAAQDEAARQSMRANAAEQAGARTQNTELQAQLKAARQEQMESMRQLNEAESERKKLEAQLEIKDNRTAYLENTIRIMKKENAKNLRNAIREDRQTQRRKAEARAKDTKARQQIKKTADELKKMIAKPTEQSYVPADTILKLSELLEAFQSGDKRRIDTKTAQWMKKVQEMRDSGNEMTARIFDKGFQTQMQEAVNILQDKGVNDLESEELQYVANVFTEAKHQIRNATRMIGRQKNTDAIMETKSAVDANMKQKGVSNNSFIRGIQKFTQEHLSPKRFFNQLAGYQDNAWSRTGEDMIEGQRMQERARQLMVDDIRSLTDSRENLKRFEKFAAKRAELIDTGYTDARTGKKIQITQAQRVSLYLHSLNEDNLRHFIYGATLPDQELLRAGKKKEAYDRGLTLKLIDMKGHEQLASQIGEIREAIDKFYDQSTSAEEKNRIRAELREKAKNLNNEKAIRAKNELLNFLKGQINRSTVMSELNNAIKMSQQERIEAVKAALDKITAGMTDYEKAWVRGYQAIEKKSTAYINETSMQLNGYNKATVDNYFPIKTDRDFLPVDFESLVANGTIEGMGFLKDRVKGSNPMVIEDVTDVINRMINATSLYYGLAIPVRNFNKMYNGTLGGYEDSVKASLKRTWGSEGVEYLERLMSDLQGSGRNEERTFLDSFRSKYAGSVLTLNPSVMMKQAASLPTAAASLGWSPIMKALGTAKKVDVNLINRYTSAYIERANGGIRDMEANANRNTTAKRGLYKIGNGIQAVDLATIRKVWQASEYHTQENHPELKIGSEEYYQQTARTFETAVEDTQPEYGVMQRPHILRTKNQLLRSVTMFKTQSIQNFNILYDAGMNLRAQAAAYKANKSAENEQKLKQARTQMARAASSQIVSAAVLAVMTALGKALLHKPENYQDEKGEITAGSAAYQLSKDMISSMAGMMVGGGELFDLISGIAEGKAPYDIEAGSISLLNDVYQSTYKLGNAAAAIGDSSLTQEQKLTKLGKAGKSFAENVAAALGIPAANVEKIFTSAYSYVDDIISGRGLEGLTTGDVTLTTAAKYMGEALQKGDKETYTRLYNRLLKQGKSQSQINSAMKSWLKTGDPRIQQAAAAIDSGDIDTYNSILNEMTAQGFSMAQVVQTVEKARSDSEETGEAEEAAVGQLTYDQIIAGQENESASAYTYAQMNSLLDSGNVTAAKKVQSQLFKSKGTTAVKSALTSYWKPKYQEAYQARNRTELNRITKLLRQMGYSDSTISKWKSVDANGGSSTSSKKSSGFGSGGFGSSRKSSKKKSSGFGSGGFGR